MWERTNTLPWYALQVDKSTDLDNKEILVYLKYVYQEDVHEDMLLLPTRTTAADLFMLLDNYISVKKIKWIFIDIHGYSCCHDQTVVWFNCLN